MKSRCWQRSRGQRYKGNDYSVCSTGSRTAPEASCSLRRVLGEFSAGTRLLVSRCVATPRARTGRIRPMNILAAKPPLTPAPSRSGATVRSSHAFVLRRDQTRKLCCRSRGDAARRALGFADVDGIAFGAGPGSFTGLRVACGVARAAFARDLPLLGVGTLEAMALESGFERVIVLLDARMGEVYAGFSEHGEQRGEIGVYSPQSIPLPESGGWLACGNALARLSAAARTTVALRRSLAARADAQRRRRRDCRVAFPAR